MKMCNRLTLFGVMVAFLVACQPKNTHTENTTVIKEGPQSTGPQAQNSGGVDVGNGGDAIRCSTSPENSFSGLYALDFFLTESPSAPKVQAVKSWEESRDRIFSYLNKIHPQLAWSFYDFFSQIENHTNYESDRVWEASTNDLIYLKDQKIITKLPTNCGGKDKTEVYQAVIRQKKATHTTYHYSQDLLSDLRQQSLQFSFLMVHEWLWDLTEDVAAIRQLNRLLHSNQLETMSRESLMAIMGNLGMKVQLPIIDRGVYAPQSGVQANTEGDFSQCTIIPQIQANPRKLVLLQDGSSSCWNYVGESTLTYNCKVENSGGAANGRPKTICTLDKDILVVINNAPIDVETIEILSHRHLVVNLASGPKRAKGMQVHYYYADYQYPARP